MGDSAGQSLHGDLHIYPFRSPDRSELVAQHYQTLLSEYGTEDILCLTRLCNEERLSDEIAKTLSEVARPTTTSLTDFAAEVLPTIQPGVRTLSDNERIELLAAFLSEQEWDTEYLARAAQQDSFQQDVGEILIEMESRNALSPSDYTSPVLAEIATVGRDFQSHLADRGFVDRPSLLPTATAALEKARTEKSIPRRVDQWNVLLVADYEEFATTERQFLQAISEAADAPIVAIAARQSRILSSWREAGGIESLAAGLDTAVHELQRESVSAPEAVGEYLVTGSKPENHSPNGSVEVIEAATFREQLTQVANEIERLVRRPDYTYTDIAVMFQDSGGPVEETLRLLRRHGIPTTTVAVSQLGNDPAVRELYDVAKTCAALSDSDQDASRERILSVEGGTEDPIAGVEASSTAIDGLWHWLAATHLKERIAENWTELDARDQFRRVREVVGLAEFLEEEPDLDGSWIGFLTALERAFKYSSSRLDSIEPETHEGGVPVGTIYGQKHENYKAVFLLNVTDSEYPSTPDLTALLPTKRLEEEKGYPLLTSQSVTDITETFQPASETHEKPFHAYFTQVSRRLLGIGIASAAERLYFGVPQESADALGTYNQPSRFLSELVENFEMITPLTIDGESEQTSHGGASEVVVEHVDDTLDAVRRAGVGGETVDLNRFERELAAIESVLDHPEAKTVQAALEARIDFRQGRVRRD
ncbi:hypothetical protein [Haloarchaeobius sp. FL176]|uniref:hypothetical protein n=1 Tax=Haloarchaeobius sp. FL176 TaxID=2967129 RepID=UPI002147AE41|nr:hypothetical protein [Haloarchaeobius sp. FL176]